LQGTDQTWIKLDKHAAGEVRYLALENPEDIFDGAGDLGRQPRVVPDCLVAEPDPPGLVGDNVPSRERRAKSMDLDPASGSREVRLNGTLRTRRGIWMKLASDSGREVLEEKGQPPRTGVTVDFSCESVTVDFHPPDFIQREDAVEKDNTQVTKPLSEEIVVA
jgi:hypothetical protein